MRAHLLLQVAVERSRGNTTAAIDSLRKYLDNYQNDKEAWEELADLYLEVSGSGPHRELMAGGCMWCMGQLHCCWGRCDTAFCCTSMVHWRAMGAASEASADE